MVYNGYDHNLNIGSLIEDGKISGPDGMNNPFTAHQNTLDPDSEYGDSELLYNVGEQIDAGTYQNWLASGQIAEGSQDGTFNPNNLGYDVSYKDDTIGKVDKAQISITLDDIYRIYGNGAVHSDREDSIKNQDGYGYSYTIENGELTDKMKAQLKALGFTVTADGAVTIPEGSSHTVTNDANDENEQGSKLHL